MAQVNANAPITVSLAFDGIAKYDIYLCDLKGDDWVATTLLAQGGHSLSSQRDSFIMPALSAGQRRLLYVSLEMAKVGGGAISATLTVSQDGAKKASVTSDPCTVAKNEWADTTLACEVSA